MSTFLSWVWPFNFFPLLSKGLIFLCYTLHKVFISFAFCFCVVLNLIVGLVIGIPTGSFYFFIMLSLQLLFSLLIVLSCLNGGNSCLYDVIVFLRIQMLFSKSTLISLWGHRGTKMKNPKDCLTKYVNFL